MARTENPLYSIWLAIRSRCSKPRDSDWPLYGALGIRMCRQWRDPRRGFRRFLLDVGPRPPGTVLARLDTRQNYTPRNVRWATRAELNRKTQWCRLTREDAEEIAGRLEHGEGPQSIARRFGVFDSLVYAIRAGKVWRDVQPIRAHRR
jgi:hypothetical protein